MTNFWPSDINLEDTSSPIEIIDTAKAEWIESSGGLLTLVVEEAISSESNDLLIVHAKHVPSRRTITLFSVTHRPRSPYPARIYPSGDELPDYFKKTYYKPGIGENSGVFGMMSGKNITNEWVCESPSEFRQSLKKVLNLGNVKANLLSLISSASIASSVGETEEAKGTISE